jgi:hypothetical protein
MAIAERTYVVNFLVQRCELRVVVVHRVILDFHLCSNLHELFFEFSNLLLTFLEFTALELVSVILGAKDGYLDKEQFASDRVGVGVVQDSPYWDLQSRGGGVGGG